MVKRVFDRAEQKFIDDDPLKFITWMIGYKMKKHFYVIKAAILFVVSYLQIFNFICIKEILNKNFMYLEYLPAVFVQQTGCFGLLLVFAYIKYAFQYQEILLSTFWSISSGGEKTKDRILRESKIIKLICAVNYGLCILIYLSWFPLVGDEKRLLFAVMYCTKHFEGWSKVLIFILYLCLLLVACGIVCPLYVTIYFIFHAKFQFYLLSEDIREIPKEDLKGRIRLRSKLLRQITIYERLSRCAKHHAVIKMVTNTFFRKTQNLTMLVYSALGALAIVSAYCFIIFEFSPSSNWRMILNMVTTISVFLTFCVCGQKATDESNQFLVTLCNTPWYHWNKRCKMVLGMMITNSLEPMRISCFGVADLNYALILLVKANITSLLRDENGDSVKDKTKALNYCNNLFDYTDVSSEQMLVQRLAELQVKLQYLDSMYRARQEDLQQLTQHIDQIGIPTDNSSAFTLPPHELRPEIKQLIKNMSGMHAATGVNPPIMLRLPSSYHFLPHLLDDPSSLRLAYLMSKNRNGVSVVMGVPTVRREKQSYLMDTLQNLIEGMSPEEANDSLIVVFVAETDLEYVLQVAKEVEVRFPIQVDSGLIEVVSPSPAYYPNLDKLRITLGDSPERVRWRSKQNLDFAFLMSYSQPKGTFYVQLEDDILAKPSYVTEMKKFAIEKIARKEPWFVLDFCQLGFIGKMFKSAELPWLIQFFQMFYNDKPVDWLLDHLIYTKICNWEKNNDYCKRDKAKMWIHYKPSLFQHIGTHSSLKGKVQKLKDKQFGKVALFFPHSNPEAEIVSGIKHYKQYTLERAYLGETFFWGLLPQTGDQLVFKFSTPIVVKRFYFKSGNAEHPSDKFYNTTVEVLPVESNQYSNSLNVTSDGYIVVGKFDSTGIATGVPDDSIGKVQSIRLNVHSESDNWAILSEIHIQDELASR